MAEETTTSESFANATLPGADEKLLAPTEFPEDEFPDPDQEARDLGADQDEDA